MQRIAQRLLKIFLLFLITLPLGRDSIAEAQGNLNARLRGDYFFSRTRTCVQNVDGFGTNFELLGAGNSFTDAARGVRRYNGGGTGSMVDGHLLLVGHTGISASSFPVTENTFTCNLTYAVSPDGSFTENASCSGMILSGLRAGQTFTTTGIGMRGQITGGGRTLLLDDTNGNVETITFSGPPTPSTFQRICNRSGTAVKHQ